MKRSLILALLLGSVAISAPATALTAEQTVEREVVVKNADGTEMVRRETAESVIPGENIVYSINYYNDLDKPAENVVLVMPVPSELTLIEGSAQVEGAVTTYSADGGKSFAVREDVRVAIDDSELRAAEADDITHIKWIVASITPEQRGTLSFKGKLK